MKVTSSGCRWSTVFSLRSPEALAAALRDVGFSQVEVQTPPSGKTHLISATRSAAAPCRLARLCSS